MSEWVDFGALQTFSRHTISVVAVVISFRIVAGVIEFLVPTGPVRTILEWVEEFVIIGSFGWLVVEYAAMLWAKRVWKKNSNGHAALVLA